MPQAIDAAKQLTQKTRKIAEALARQIQEAS